MSQRTLEKGTTTVEGDQRTSTASAETEPATKVEHHDVAGILAKMTFAERVRAYRKEVFSRRELSAVAAREPDRMPLLNGEFEWIAISLADLD